MSLPTLPDGARWVHAIGDDPRECAGCAFEIRDDPTTPPTPHDPEPAGMDPDNGEPWCFCGHSLVPMRTDWLVLRIRHDQPSQPSDAFAEAVVRMLGRALDAAGITAVVDVTTEPRP